jgi:hypothetical protein
LFEQRSLTGLSASSGAHAFSEFSPVQLSAIGLFGSQLMSAEFAPPSVPQ